MLRFTVLFSKVSLDHSTLLRTFSINKFKTNVPAIRKLQSLKQTQNFNFFNYGALKLIISFACVLNGAQIDEPISIAILQRNQSIEKHVSPEEFFDRLINPTEISHLLSS